MKRLIVLIFLSSVALLAEDDIDNGCCASTDSFTQTSSISGSGHYVYYSYNSSSYINVIDHVDGASQNYAFSTPPPGGTSWGVTQCVGHGVSISASSGANHIDTAPHSGYKWQNISIDIYENECTPNCDENQTVENGVCVDNATDENATSEDLPSSCRASYEAMATFGQGDENVLSSICAESCSEDNSCLDAYDLYPNDEDVPFRQCCFKFIPTTPYDDNGTDLNASATAKDGKAITDAINTGTLQNHNDLEDIKAQQQAIYDALSEQYNAQRAEARQELEAMDSMEAGIQTNTDAVNEGSDNIRTAILAHTESMTTIGETAHQDAEDIKDALTPNEEDIANRDQQQNEAFAGISELVNNSIASVTNSLNAIKSGFSEVTPPTIEYSGTCNMTANIFHQDVNFAKYLDRMLLLFKPYLLFVLNFTYLLYMIRLSIYVFKDITLRASTSLMS